MSRRNKIATFAAASIFALSLGGSAMAATTADVTQRITEGQLTATVASGELGSVVYSHAAVPNAGSLTLSVNDLRGTYAGWSVTIQSSEFKYNGTVAGSHNIPADNFMLGQTAAPVKVAGQDPTGISGATNGALSAVRTPITAASNAGSGSYTQTLPVTLTVPADSPVGTYVATLTVSTAAAPGSN